ncbi:MAG: AAA family ATPase [Gammaproteobacteria bacterium RIFCSPHIGHO2_12_FULL_40_19]|nr:MAG: AAA family ATPase [Gammaproteobacteria bacterium RIFCSPHIGHO2_12_FULL_40_19]
MNPVLNPYCPGAGNQPPELAGRDELLTKASIALQRIASGRAARSIILTGLRGVGKTVLLNRIRKDAEALHLITVRTEAPDGRSLPSLLAPGLKLALMKLNQRKTTEFVKRGLRTLATFVCAMKLKYHDIEIGLDVEPEPSLPLIDDLDENLIQLFQSVGIAAQEQKTAVIIFIDELQMLDEKELGSLIMALHIVAQDDLPITLVAAGLPQIAAKMGKAKTYAERLFEFPDIGKLNSAAAKQALTVPAEKLGVFYTAAALNEILKQTMGYAYFLQEWGKHAWDIAQASPITESHAIDATQLALADLDANFFRVRFEQLTVMQKHYLRAMAELGSNPQPSGAIAAVLGKKVTELGAIREQLINKGLLYSPSFGETAFTVPLFDAFMKRVVTSD